MQLALAGKTEAQVYHLLTQLVVPRPIAWVLTPNRIDSAATELSLNLAPFSFFTPLASDPALIGFSIGNRLSGRQKDTFRNCSVIGSPLVVHIAGAHQSADVQASAQHLAYAETELDLLDSADLSSDWDFEIPRLRDCPVAFGAHVYRIVEIVPPSQQVLVIAKIEAIDVLSGAVKINAETGRTSIDPFLLDPVSRLGAGTFAGLRPII